MDLSKNDVKGDKTIQNTTNRESSGNKHIQKQNHFILITKGIESPGKRTLQITFKDSIFFWMFPKLPCKLENETYRQIQTIFPDIATYKHKNSFVVDSKVLYTPGAFRGFLGSHGPLLCFGL